jgi:predicted nucleic acid-binding protein
VTLCDTGPLVALIDRDDQYHARCVEALKVLPPRPLIVTWPCLTEAMYLLWRAGSAPAQDQLWGYLTDALVVLHTPEAREWERMRELMRQYLDAPMDLADASVVVAAERLGLSRVFTLDSHFHAYRLRDKSPFEVVP